MPPATCRMPMPHRVSQGSLRHWEGHCEACLALACFDTLQHDFRWCLGAGKMLQNLLRAVPELSAFANLKLEIPFNKDSSRIGPSDW